MFFGLYLHLFILLFFDPFFFCREYKSKIFHLSFPHQLHFVNMPSVPSFRPPTQSKKMMG